MKKMTVLEAYGTLRFFYWIYEKRQVVIPHSMLKLAERLGYCTPEKRLGWKRTKDVIKAQKFLFGIDEPQGFGPIYGKNSWQSTTESGKYYGDEKRIPPYDFKGLMTLGAVLMDGNLSRFTSKDNNYVIKTCPNLLFLGGTTINSDLRMALQNQSVDLPLKFRPIDEPQTITRLFHDADYDEHLYSKESKTGRYLVDTRTNDKYGPYVRDGRITDDVILLTVLPLRLQGQLRKRMISVIPGYGGGARLADVLCDGDVLDPIMKTLSGSRRWFQAVFTVSVIHSDHGESYDTPRLRDVIALDIL
jgi:hypothetical protein